MLEPHSWLFLKLAAAYCRFWFLRSVLNFAPFFNPVPSMVLIPAGKVWDTILLPRYSIRLFSFDPLGPLTPFYVG